MKEHIIKVLNKTVVLSIILLIFSNEILSSNQKCFIKLTQEESFLFMKDILNKVHGIPFSMSYSRNKVYIVKLNWWKIPKFNKNNLKFIFEDKDEILQINQCKLSNTNIYDALKSNKTKIYILFYAVYLNTYQSNKIKKIILIRNKKLRSITFN